MQIFKSTGVKLLRDVYERIIQLLNQNGETSPPPPKPDKFGLTVDFNARVIHSTRAGKSLDLSQQNKLWQLFKALYQAETSIEAEDAVEGPNKSKKGMTTEQLHYFYSGEKESIRSQIQNLKSNLKDLGITIQLRKYRLHRS